MAYTLADLEKRIEQELNVVDVLIHAILNDNIYYGLANSTDTFKAVASIKVMNEIRSGWLLFPDPNTPEARKFMLNFIRGRLAEEVASPPFNGNVTGNIMTAFERQEWGRMARNFGGIND